jgi:hypothetical protein
MTPQEKAKIIEKMRAIMALGKDAGATEGERDAAMHHLTKLMAKHNIDLAEVEGARPMSEQEIMEGHVLEKHEFYGRPWARTIVNAAAKLMFCTYFSYDSSKKNMALHTFCGTPENVAAAVILAKFLVEGVYSEGSRQARIQDPNHASAWRRSFGAGAGVKIYQRVKELMAAPATEYKGGTALALTSVYQQADERNRMVLAQKYGVTLRSRNSSAKSTVDENAFAAGKAHGAKMNLGRNL